MATLNPRATGLVALSLAAGLLVAGWWPFALHPPNRVDWLKDRAGLSFQPDGVAYDPELMDWSGGGFPDQPAACTVEIRLEPCDLPGNNVFHILTIDDGQCPPGFALCQWKTELLLRVRDSSEEQGFREVSLTGALTGPNPRLITVTMDSFGTFFCRDASPRSGFPGFVVSNSRLNGRLILGNAATGKHPWTGHLFGLAAFNRALDASEVARHHALWASPQPQSLAAESGLAALYLFDEGGGRRANDRSERRRGLMIPERYQVLRKHVLEPPWGPGRIQFSDLDDIVINVLGFVPFGFVLLIHRRLLKPEGRAWNVVWVTAAGATLSLLIELTQVWLPNRSSSATDLLCNTVGTYLGALLASRWPQFGTRAEAGPVQ